jgi:hypothetical protein
MKSGSMRHSLACGPAAGQTFPYEPGSLLAGIMLQRRFVLALRFFRCNRIFCFFGRCHFSWHTESQAHQKSGCQNDCFCHGGTPA